MERYCSVVKTCVKFQEHTWHFTTISYYSCPISNSLFSPLVAPDMQVVHRDAWTWDTHTLNEGILFNDGID